MVKFYSPIELYKGRVIEQLPRLLKDGRIPVPLRYVWQQRLEEFQPNPKIREWYRISDVFTGDLCLRNDQGDLKIMVYRPGVNDKQYFGLLRRITATVPLLDGALELRNEYSSIDAPEIVKWRMINLNRDLSEEEAIEKEELQILLNKDISLIRKHHRLTMELSEAEAGCGVYLHPAHVTSLRLWVAGSVNYNGNVVGGNNLDDDSGRLVGVAPEALMQYYGLPEVPLETRIQIDLNKAA